MTAILILFVCLQGSTGSAGFPGIKGKPGPKVGETHYHWKARCKTITVLFCLAVEDDEYYDDDVDDDDDYHDDDSDDDDTDGDDDG